MPVLLRLCCSLVVVASSLVLATPHLRRLHLPRRRSVHSHKCRRLFISPTSHNARAFHRHDLRPWVWTRDQQRKVRSVVLRLRVGRLTAYGYQANRMRAMCIMGLALFLLGISPAAAQDQTLTGWFSFIVTDYPSDTGLTSETTYFLTEDLGEQHELLIDVELIQSLGGPMALNRERVTVVGEWEQHEPDAPAQFWVHSIERAVLPSSALPGRPFASDLSPDETALPWSPLQSTETDSQVRGSLPLVTILCRFADATDVTPHPVSHYEGLIGSSPRSLDHYWREVSYGNIDLAGSVVVGWYNLPRLRSYYVYDRDGDGEEDHDFRRLIEDCTAAGDADVFFPDFWGINLVFNQSLGSAAGVAGIGPSHPLTKDGQTRHYGTMALPQEKGYTGWAAEHEMAHMLGLQHSSGPYDETYDSKWDVVSRGAGRAHTIAYHKDFLGWIPPARKYVAAPNTTRTITLERLAQPGAEGYLMAQIPIGESDTDFYTVEARLFAGYDEGIPGEAVLIHKVDTTRGDRLAQVVDVDNNGDPNDDGAMWTAGELFTDRENNLQVSIDAVYATGYRVTINTNPATFSPCIDFLFSSSPILGPGEDSASVQVKAASDCEWSARSNTEWIRVTSGGSSAGPGSVRYTVATNPSPAARTGTLTIGEWTFPVTQAGVNDVLFEDDMENGANDQSWAYSPLYGLSPWALTTAASRSGTQAWTDSPGGHYQNDDTAVLQTPLIDLTEVSAATLIFWHQYDFGDGDEGHVWVESKGKDSARWQVEHVRTFKGTNLTWQPVSIDLTSFVGGSVYLSFQLRSDATHTADGWYIDDVAVYSTDFEIAEPPPPLQATLENPAPESFQSGIGVISGWACEAQRIEIAFNDGPPQEAAYGTSRGDTQGTCGDTDNGFGLLFNWNLLGDGIHTVQALADGVEFASLTVIVTTLGEEFLHGASGALPLADFPDAGASRTLRWQQSQQNFVLTDGSPGRGGGTSGAPPYVLENPVPGSFQSGISLISGWVCDAQTITIRFDGGPPQEAAYGTSRGDTQGACGDTDNGFGLPFNWNLLDDGLHTVSASADGVEFARVEITVTTLGTEFRRGLSREVLISDFPHVGTDVVLQWQEAQQNFVITATLPTIEQVAVTSVVTFPAGVQVPNVAVRSLYADTAEVLARPEPSLLLAEDAGGTVLLGVANMDGGLLGERVGSVAVSVDSTAIVLVALIAGYAVHAIDQSLVDAIQAHATYRP